MTSHKSKRLIFIDLTLTSDEEESDDERSFQEIANKDSRTLTSDEEKESDDKRRLQKNENEGHTTSISDEKENDDDESSRKSENQADIDEDSDIDSSYNIGSIRPQIELSKEKSLNSESFSDIQLSESEIESDKEFLSSNQRDIESGTVFYEIV